jgi:methyl-accepting chemotaxis protein WspA
MDKFSEEVRRGIDDVHEVGGQLSKIIEQVQPLVPCFETANEAMQAQSVGAEQITEAILQLTESTRETVESIRQSTRAIDGLDRVPTSLRNNISRVRRGVA